MLRTWWKRRVPTLVDKLLTLLLVYVHIRRTVRYEVEMS